MQKQSRREQTQESQPKKIHKHSRPLDDEPGVELAAVEVEYGRRDFSGVDFRGLDHMGGEGRGVMETAWVVVPVASPQSVGEGTA